MKKWTVELTSKAEKQLLVDFKNKAIEPDDIKVIKRWIYDVEEKGLEYAQMSKDWRDHELEGVWKGHRAISFSYRGRLIYRIENEKVIVRVVRVSTNHDYA